MILKIKSILKNIPFLILLFPIILVIYIISVQGSLSYNEDIIIESDIEKVIKLHENTSLLKNYMQGFVSYEIKKGIAREKGSIAQITVLFDYNKSISRKILMTETILENNLPFQKKIIYNTGAVKNVITYRFIKKGEDKTQFVRNHNYEFNTYKRFSSFFTSKKIKRQSYVYLKNFKHFVENY
tara:strand:- start:293 stop:841 length:549 start_codon:yes stop_codon:yes gene_type:complete